jgi:hypothetical protein
MSKLQKPIDNICFYYDPITSTRYEKKKDVPIECLSRCEYWDSILEFRVYEELLKIYPSNEIKRQCTIELMPKLEPFKAWTWCIDFKINSPSPIYIEAKGKWLIESLKSEGFCKNLRMIQKSFPDVWNRLFFIGSDKDGSWHLPYTNIQVYPIRELKHLLQENATINA